MPDADDAGDLLGTSIGNSHRPKVITHMGIVLILAHSMTNMA